MNLHEYQAKQLLAAYQLPISAGVICENVEQTLQAIQQLQGDAWVAKCQVHAGGRGKAGGVQLVHNATEMQNFAQKWLGHRLVTKQTDQTGLLVNKIYVEECSQIQQEFYFVITIDRSKQTIVVMTSSAGGVNIEEIAAKAPHLIQKTYIHPNYGAMHYQGRELAFQLGLQGEQVNAFTHLFLQACKLFVEKDLSLLEINPLILTKEGKLLCLDAKIKVDSNALFRHPELKAMQDISQEDPKEIQAEQHQLNYVALEGNIGCLVNGAGLAMGTMDMIKLYGGEPANFLDVGGGVTKERVTEAFKIILSDPKVKVILVNILGGIVSCEIIAEGIIAAINNVQVNVPVVARLEGNKAELGLKRLSQSQLNIITTTSLENSVKQAVQYAEGK